MKKVILPVLAVAGLIALTVWWFSRPDAGALPVLFGAVEFRQVELSFNNTERVAAVLVEEGDRVTAGQVLARLETDRLKPQVAQAHAQAAALQQVVQKLRNGARPEEIAQAAAQRDALRQTVTRLKNGARPEERAQAVAQTEVARQALARLQHGSRPEEIAQARANLAAATAADRLAFDTYTRVHSLFKSSGGGAVSQQDVDAAHAAQAAAAAQKTVAEQALALAVTGPRQEDIAAAQARLTAAEQAQALVAAGPRAEDIAEAEARLAAADQALALVKAGPRAEDIAEAQARLAAAQATAALLDRQWADVELRAPVDAIVRARILEPGEMASPQRPALLLALSNPKWVRAYLSETDHVQMGARAQITVDSLPGQTFDGWVGFISPVAEFTPRAVQTEELRTSLVYEVRVFVRDPDDRLRLGLPATVRFTGETAPPPTAPTPAASPAPASPAPAGTAQP